MTAQRIDGKTVANRVLASVASRAEQLRAQEIHPLLSFVMVGESVPARIYANRLEKAARPLGIQFCEVRLPESARQSDLEETARELSNNERVDGILIQMPLPAQLTHANLGDIIDPRKDVDGITVRNAGRLYLEMPGQFPSTALAMMEILDDYGIHVEGKDAVVVGRSKVVGHPVAELLLRRNATVTIAHRRTRDLASHTRRAEILMVAVGEPNLIKGDMLKPRAVVIDAGINSTDAGLVGDVALDEAMPVVSAITPVPGGVGPVTNAVLLRSVIVSAEQRCV